MIRKSDSGDKPYSDDPLLLTDREVAGLLSISRRTVWRLTSTGELPKPIKLGRASRWRRADLEAFISEVEVSP